MGFFSRGGQLASYTGISPDGLVVSEVWLYPNTRAVETARESGNIARRVLSPQEIYSGVLCCGIGFGREGREAFISHKASERVDYVFFLERVPDPLVPEIMASRGPYLEAVLCHVARSPDSYGESSDIAGRVLEAWDGGYEPLDVCTPRDLSLLLDDCLSVRERDGKRDRDVVVYLENGNGSSPISLNCAKAKVFEDLVVKMFEHLAEESGVYVAANVRKGTPEHKAEEIDLIVFLEGAGMAFWRGLFSRVETPSYGLYGEGCVGGVIFSRRMAELVARGPTRSVSSSSCSRASRPPREPLA